MVFIIKVGHTIVYIHKLILVINTCIMAVVAINCIEWYTNLVVLPPLLANFSFNTLFTII